MLVAKQGTPCLGKDFLQVFNDHLPRQFGADGTYCLEIGYRGGSVYHDAAEQLIMDVAVQMFDGSLVRKARIGFQYHQSYLAHRRKVTGDSFSPIFFAKDSKGKESWIRPKFTAFETLPIFFDHIEFCKRQNGLHLGHSSYICHKVDFKFPRFKSLNSKTGGTSKETKKPTNSQ